MGGQCKPGPPIRQPGRCAVTTSSPIFCSDNHVQESPCKCLENIVCPQQWPTTTEVQNVKQKCLTLPRRPAVYMRLRGMRNPNVESLTYT